MAQLEQLNLPRVTHNPLTGSAAQGSLSDNMEKGRRAVYARQQAAIYKQQAAYAKDMHKYKMKQMQRAERDYEVNKRAQNFVFSHYPSSKPKGDFASMMNNLKFGAGTREKHLEEWKKNVGGNLQGFEQWYNSSKAAEMKALQTTLIRDPLRFKTEESFTDYVSQTIGGLSPDDRQAFFANLDPETYQIVNKYWSPAKSSGSEFGYKIDTIAQHIEDDWKGYATVGTAVAAGVGLWKKFRKNPVEASKQVEKVLKKAGVFSGEKAPLMLKSAVMNGSKMSKGEIARLMEKGLITGKEAKALANGKKILPSKLIQGKDLGSYTPAGPSKSRNIIAEVADEPINPKFYGQVDDGIQKLIKGGQLSKKQGQQLNEIIIDLKRSGKDLTPNSLYKAIKAGGSKYESLATALGQKSVKGIGPLKKAGLLSSIGLGAAGYYGGSMIGEGVASMMGASDHNAEVYGDAAGLAGTVPAAAMAPLVIKLKSVVQKKGMGYVMQKLATRVGWKVAGSIMAKALAAPVTGGASMLWLAADAYFIYDALSELE